MYSLILSLGMLASGVHPGQGQPLKVCNDGKNIVEMNVAEVEAISDLVYCTGEYSVTGYSIGFMMHGSYYSKKFTGHTMDDTVRDLFISSQAPKLFLDVSLEKTGEKPFTVPVEIRIKE